MNPETNTPRPLGSVDTTSDSATAHTPLSALAPIRLKTILVPVDFSDCGRKALQYAMPLAHQFGGQLILLYVVQEPYPVTEFGGLALAQMENDLCADAAAELEKFAAEEVRPQVPVTTSVVVGTPEIQIVDKAKSDNVDLIVISTHGRTGLKHIFIGSVVENVVRHAPCPVLVVRESEHEFVATEAIGS